MKKQTAVSPAAEAVAPEFLLMLEAGSTMGFTRKGLAAFYTNLTERQIRSLTEKAEAQGLIERDKSPNAVSGSTFVVYVLTEKGRLLSGRHGILSKKASTSKAPSTKLGLVPVEEQLTPEEEKKGKKGGKKAKAAKAPKTENPEAKWAEVPPTMKEGRTTEPETGLTFAAEPIDKEQFDVVVDGFGAIDRVRKVKAGRYPSGVGFIPKGDPNGNPQRTLTSACRSSIRHWDRRGRKPVESAKARQGGGALLTTF